MGPRVVAADPEIKARRAGRRILTFHRVDLRATVERDTATAQRPWRFPMRDRVSPSHITELLRIAKPAHTNRRDHPVSDVSDTDGDGTADPVIYRSNRHDAGALAYHLVRGGGIGVWRSLLWPFMMGVCRHSHPPGPAW